MNSFEQNGLKREPAIYKKEEHNVSRQDIDADALKIIFRLSRSGHKAYLVGGGVRDLLLGKKPKDFDIATDATPRRVKALFRNCRIIGRRFKLAHIYFGQGKIIEVSTFRDESDPIGPEPEENGESETPELAAPVRSDNRYGSEVTDAFRRDLTVNALFYDPTTYQIIDYTGGMNDLRSEIVRIIGTPLLRYREDPVRMLRVIRHAARAGFSIDQETWETICRNRDLILSASFVRIFEEIKKDLLTGHFVETLRLLHESGLLEILMPDLSQNAAVLFHKKSLFTRMLGSVDSSALEGSPLSPTTSMALLVLSSRDDGMGEGDLAGLFHDNQDISDQIARCFRKLPLPRREKEKMEAILWGWYYLSTCNPDHLNPSRIRVRDCQDEFLSFLSIADSSGQLLHLYEEAAKESQSHGRRKRGGRHQPRVEKAPLPPERRKQVH